MVAKNRHKPAGDKTLGKRVAEKHAEKRQLELKMVEKKSAIEDAVSSGAWLH